VVYDRGKFYDVFFGTRSCKICFLWYIPTKHPGLTQLVRHTPVTFQTLARKMLEVGDLTNTNGDIIYIYILYNMYIMEYLYIYIYIHIYIYSNLTIDNNKYFGSSNFILGTIRFSCDPSLPTKVVILSASRKIFEDLQDH
jgi:hypothetical protein